MPEDHAKTESNNCFIMQFSLQKRRYFFLRFTGERESRGESGARDTRNPSSVTLVSRSRLRSLVPKNCACSAGYKQF